MGETQREHREQLVATQLPARDRRGLQAAAPPASDTRGAASRLGDHFNWIDSVGLAGAVALGWATGTPALGVCAWFLYELVYPRLLAVAVQPYRWATAMYSLPLRVLLGPLLALAFVQLFPSQPGSDLAIAYAVVWGLELAQGALAARLAPAWSLKAHIALLRARRRHAPAAVLQARLRPLLLASYKQSVARADGLRERSPSRARRLYERVVNALAHVPARTPEETEALAAAHVGLGSSYENAGEAPPAIESYLAARRLGHTGLGPTLAALLAGEERTESTAVEVYLEYLAGVREGAGSAASPAVLAVLERACGTNVADTPDRVLLAIRRAEQVLAVDTSLPWAHFSLGAALLHPNCPARDAARALASLERARQLDPTRAATHRYLADSYIECKRPESAIAALEECLRLEPAQPMVAVSLATLLDASVPEAASAPPDPGGAARLERAAYWLAHAAGLTNDPAHFDLLGQSHMRRGAFERAAEAFARAASLAPQRKEYVYRLALAQQAGGKTEEAKDSLLKAVALDRDFLAAHRLLAELQFEAADYGAAAGSYRQVRRLDAGDMKARFRLGRSLYEVGQHHSAARELAGVAPAQREATFYLARAQAKLGDVTRAAATLERLHATFGEGADSLYYLGCARAHAALADTAGSEDRTALLEGALAAFRAAADMDADGAWKAHLQAGHACRWLGRMADARRHYLQAQASGREVPEVLSSLGQVAYLSGDSDHARIMFEQAVAIAPEHAPGHLGLGVIHEERNDLQQALDAYRRAGHEAAAGAVCCKMGEHRAARAHLTAARQAGDESDELLSNLGFALAQCGELADAMATWRVLYERNPDDTRVALNLTRLQYLLGRQNAQAGRYAEAVQAWSAYLAAYPGDDAVRRDVAEAHFRLALAELERSEDANGALSGALRQAAELAPDNPTYAYHLALYELTTGNAAGARTRLSALLGAHPGSAEYAHHLALTLLQDDVAGSTERARELLHHAAKTAENWDLGARARWALAGLNTRDGQWQEAADLFAQTVS